MDIIGVGSLPIVVLTGGFSGAIIALQMARALNTYGASSQVGSIVTLTLVRELGPVLTALLVAGRNASGIASELGSMKVTEQIDAMRALGTDPVQKLVTPRLIATALMLPCLTVDRRRHRIVSEPIWSRFRFCISSTAAHIGLRPGGRWCMNDLAQGLIKPFLFGIIIALVGCFYGLRTTGGTQGVGRATTQAVVAASIWIFRRDLADRQDLRKSLASYAERAHPRVRQRRAFATEIAGRSATFPYAQSGRDPHHFRRRRQRQNDAAQSGDRLGEVDEGQIRLFGEEVTS